MLFSFSLSASVVEVGGVRYETQSAVGVKLCIYGPRSVLPFHHP